MERPSKRIPSVSQIVFLIFIFLSLNINTVSVLAASERAEVVASQPEGVQSSDSLSGFKTTPGMETDTSGNMQASGDSDAVIQQSKDAVAESDAQVDSTSLAASGERLHKSFPFYRRWWFSLLIVLLVFPFIYRYLQNGNKKWLQVINENENSIKELKQQLLIKEEQIVAKESEFNARIAEDEILKYNAIGLSMFSEIMAQSHVDFKKAGQQLIFELVKYLDTNMGAFYIAKGENDSDTVLELFSGYAPGLKQMLDLVQPGEGYIGTCFKEGLMMEITEVPETYTRIASGLGEAVPSHIVFFPLIQDEVKLGVIEIASFKKIDQYKIDFLEKITRNIASFVAIRTSTARMQEMLERSQTQAEELQAQEEEMRQNLEEMQATQEELNRQLERNQQIQDDLAKEKYLMDALMNSIPESIYFKDLDSKFIKNSKSHAALFGFDNPKDIAGKSDFDFFSDVHARPAFEAEQNIIKTGKPILDLVEKEVKKDGSVTWVSTTKMRLIDQNGNVVGTFGISKDITAAKKTEIEIQEKTEILKAQEEELRQNLEEMQTVQEELVRQKAELDWEKHLMDTLLNSLPEYIYFKDKDSKFIKNSLSHIRLFGFSDPKELLGKSDFDFFSDEHARPAFEDEQKIIRTGKAILNLVEKEVKKDGTITWVHTSKMPLYDKQGNIIGTFGISKDITETKKMEQDIQQRNQELLAQEEELRQNLEEMHAIQDELQRRIQENDKFKADGEKREKELIKKLEELKKGKK
jgi:PAS domain S-box-containing protein